MGKKLNNSIQKKLTRSFNLLILCALFITNCTLYLFLEQHYSEALISNYHTVKDNVSSQIESDLSSIESYARMVCVDNTLQDLVRSKASLSGYSHYRSLRDITSLLSKYIALKSDMIGDIYIMDAAGNPITPNGFYQDTAESGWYREFLERGVDSGFTSVHKEYQRGANLQLNQEKVISYIVGMYDQNGPAQKSSFLGYLIFNIKFSALTSRLGAYDEMHFILLDSGGAQIWARMTIEQTSCLRLATIITDKGLIEITILRQRFPKVAGNLFCPLACPQSMRSWPRLQPCLLLWWCCACLLPGG
jgi:hypothetical protein